MTIMVTGGSGFIGINLLKKLADQGKEVVSFSRGGFQKGSDEFIGSSISRVHFVSGNVLDFGEIKTAINKFGVKLIIHAAAATPASPVMERSLWSQAIQINIVGTVNALEAAFSEGVERFVYVSSVVLYGRQDPDRPMAEDLVPRPTMLYAVTKYTSELLTLRFGEIFEKLEVRSVRITSIYGPMERPTQMRRVPSFIYEWCTAAISGKNVKVKDNVTMRRDFTHVSDTVDGIILVALASSPKHKVYNISSGKSYALSTVLNTIQRLEPRFQFAVILQTEKKGSQRVLPFGPLDITKARSDLGYVPKYDLERGLREYLEWLRVHYSQVK